MKNGLLFQILLVAASLVVVVMLALEPTTIREVPTKFTLDGVENSDWEPRDDDEEEEQLAPSEAEPTRLPPDRARPETTFQAPPDVTPEPEPTETTY